MMDTDMYFSTTNGWMEWVALDETETRRFLNILQSASKSPELKTEDLKVIDKILNGFSRLERMSA
jgi:hypothetical protein